jgi:hypothetical protein
MSVQLINPHWGALSEDHYYWRIYITGGGSEPYTGVRWLEFAELHQVQHALGTAIDGGNLGSTVNAPKAFDGDWNTRWEAGPTMPEWLGMQYATPVKVDVVRMFDYTQQRYPSAFDVQYSDNGTDWTTAWSVGSRSFNGGMIPHVNPLLPKSLFRVRSTWGDYSAVAEFYLRTTPGGASVGVRAHHGDGYLGNQHGWESFDGNNGSFWFMNPNGHMTMELAVPFEDLVEFGMRVSSSDARMMRSFKLQTSSDGGVTWDDEKTVTGLSAWSVGEARAWSIP